MVANIIATLGGVGLFLLGMIWLTEGLRGLTGHALRMALARFTRTPYSGALAGAVATAAIQSSSATTVMAVGFVSAGLITFPQALGVIFGANIGTTITGWLVAILGFKLHLGEIVLPLVFVSALLKLFGRERLSMFGTALGGFSLIFVGIDAMQAGMAGFEGIVTPTSFPGDSLFGRLQLVLIGIAITLVTQSSSAGVATALAALGAGAINFPQAAAMVIGMDVGTTFTAVLATVGGATATRRTGLSHVIYNVMTGIMALFLLGPFTTLAAPLIGDGNGQIALVAFHTCFNVLGVLLVLPFTASFARLISTLVPERGPHLTQHLDRRLLQDADSAVDAVAGTVAEIASAQIGFLVERLNHALSYGPLNMSPREIADALSELRRFVEEIEPQTPDPRRAGRIVAALHAIDHLERLHFRCNQESRLEALGQDHRLRRLGCILGRVAEAAMENGNHREAEIRFDRTRRLLRSQRKVYRERLIVSASSGKLDVATVPARLDALRWLHRVSYHLWRIAHHLALMQSSEKSPSPSREAEIEVVEGL
jgi:phosphate:Na+ symporter